MSSINLKTPQSLRIQGYMESVEETSTAGIAEALDIPQATVTATVAELYRRELIHVSNWGRTEWLSPFKIYKWGDGVDVPLPPKKSKAAPPKAEVLPFPRCDVAAQWLNNEV